MRKTLFVAMFLLFFAPSADGNGSEGWQSETRKAHDAFKKGKYDQAIEHWMEARRRIEESGRDDPEVGEILRWIGEAHRRNQNLPEAANSFNLWVAWARKQDSKTELARALPRLAELEEEAGRFDQAYRLRVETIGIEEEKWAPGFVVALAHYQLARNLVLQGNHSEAEARFQLALQKLGPDRYTTYEAQILEGYADALLKLRRDKDAESIRALAAAIRALPPDLVLQLRRRAHDAEMSNGTGAE